MNPSVILARILLPVAHFLLLDHFCSDVEREDTLDKLPTDAMKVPRVHDLAFGQGLEQV